MDLWPLHRGDDLLFYGYESLRSQVDYMATEFTQFLEQFLAAPARWINPMVTHIEPWYPGCVRPAEFKYRRVVIVAHSLGAVVARRALLNIDSSHRPPSWLTGTRLVLFAPAHKGAYISKLVFAALTGVTLGLPISSLAKLYFKSLEGLEKGSDELKALETDTLKALRKRDGRAQEPFSAVKVVEPQKESVVIQDHFGEDRRSTPAPGSTHLLVCKPREDFPQPLREVEEAFAEPDY
jgi:hypothetical protein